MIIFYFLIVVAALIGIKYRKSQKEKDTYFSKESTNAIKGIFILMVFLRHANQYVSKSEYEYAMIWDKMFSLIDALLDQLIVVMFLFISGYGVMSSIKKKGNVYIKSIAKHRVLNTLLNFDVAVFFFFILALITGRPFTCRQAFLSLLAWESLGNSTWYIFVIIACYFSTFMSFLIVERGVEHKRYMGGMIINIVILLTIGFLLDKAGKVWYDTMVSYPIGMLFAIYKDKIDTFVMLKWTYSTCLIVCMFLFVLSYVYPFFLNHQSVTWGGGGCFWWNVRIVSMIGLTVLLMMKIKIGNLFLVWLGINLFPLYIYQRIPLIIISTYFTYNPYILFSVGFMLTCAIIPAYKKIQIKL